MPLQGLRDFTELKELTPIIVNTRIRRIEAHNNKCGGQRHVKANLYFTPSG